jgi:hypothetical protein
LAIKKTTGMVCVAALATSAELAPSATIVASNEIGGERLEPPTIALAGLNGHVASHDVTGFRQALGERR